jgi:hypothetical protein
VHHFDKLRDNADRHFKAWLAKAQAGDASARTTAWGLGVDLAGLTPEAALEAVAAVFDAQGLFEQMLYASTLFGGPEDNDDATSSGFHVLRDMVDEDGMPEDYRDEARRDRILKRIRQGDYSEGDVAWLEERAAAMTDAEILAMVPFGEERVTEIRRRVGTANAPRVDHWTRRPIPPGERHLVLVEALRGREHETRHSALSAYLHVVAGDGAATEFLSAYDEHVALAS